MNPITYYIKQALADYYPDSEAASLAKLLLTQVFGFTVIELYGGKDRSFSEYEQKQLDDILIRLQKTRTGSIYYRYGNVLRAFIRG